MRRAARARRVGPRRRRPRAFVVGDDAALDAACVATADDAAALLKDAVEPVCARRTLALKLRGRRRRRGLARWQKWSEA